MIGFLRAAALLLVLSVGFSECRTQSDRPQRRSGPIRSVPVAADLKREHDFDCPEEFGYYPHPTDCTQYYVCVFGGALLESCTGGLMYSHELQTCDWPRNVGCDAIADGLDEIERVVEKKPTLPPPRRFTAAAPPPPPRAQPQPNPIVTSRGQPKITREELYEKQQQLYAEVDDLPPVEEIESDRQQRVYRGQPSTIGQVQRDRDGYAQIPSSGRTLNSNIIPASIPQSNVKIGSFSFGTQVDERRPTATQATQTYRAVNLTDSHHDQHLDIDTNEIDVTSKKVFLSRKKRNANETTIKARNEEQMITTEKIIEANNTQVKIMSKRNDGDLIDYSDDVDMEFTENEDEESIDEIERGKRQVRHGRHYYKNTYKIPGKNWGNVKPINQFDVSQYNFYVPTGTQQASNSVNQNNFFDGTRKPSNDNLYSTANPFLSYHVTQQASQHKPFKASLPDPSNQKQAYNPVNAATQIITKSPPISSLPNSDNPFASLSGGFFNNHPYHSTNQNQNQYAGIFGLNSSIRPNNQSPFIDSSLGSSSIVTGRPVLSQSPRPQNKYRANYKQANVNLSPKGQSDQNDNHNQQPTRRPNSSKDYDERDEGSSEENDSSDGSSENDDSDTFAHEFPEPPYEFTHPSNKFADIKNPFADPNFDFDEFLNKLSGGNFKPSPSTTKNQKNSALKNHNLQVEGSSPSPQQQGVRSSTLNYHGMSTPRPFSVPTSGTILWQDQSPDVQSTTRQPVQFEQIIQRPLQQAQDPYRQHQQQHQQQTILNEHIYNRPQGNAGAIQEGPKLKLKPPNFKDDRQLPINYNFNQAVLSTPRPHSINNQFKSEPENTLQHFTATQKPYYLVTGTGSPIVFSTPKQQYLVTGKPYLVTSAKPQNGFFTFKHSTAKPLTTIANEHLTALQNFWNNPSQRPEIIARPNRPSEISEVSKLKNLFVKPTSQSRVPEVTHTLLNQYFASKPPVSSTTSRPSTRKPIPKPSPEMPDYYYDEDEQYYYEPPVKSQYMPSSEVRPQRPPMAQNYQEYDDNESYEDESQETNTQKPQQTKRPSNYNRYKTDTVTKNHNDVSIVTKAPQKPIMKNNFKQNYVAIMMNSVSPTPNVLVRPEVTNYEIHHQNHRNRTVPTKKPTETGPFTIRPPKYLNQTTLRPYTVRHRLAKPTTVKSLPTPQPTQEPKPTRGRTKHPNIVTQLRVTMTTPRDSHNQETRFTKTRHDDRTNSLEPTESITATPYSASPRPKMIYNGSQSYQPDQYDPYYAVYDEDGEVYKDNDYVQQYNLASIRPAVQQTYRGTPPPPKRPVETFTARPVSPDDYDDALIHGQIVQNNQNQYQQGIRHSTRGEGNELGFELPSGSRTTQYEATSTRISTTPSTTSSTSTTTTTTQRPTTVAPFTEAMTPTPFTQRSSTNEKPVPSSPNFITNTTPPSIPLTTPNNVNFSSLAKPFEKTANLHRLRDTSTTRLPTVRLNSKKNDDSVYANDNRENKKIVSLTTGFSIRRNKNNTNNPYTLTVITRPFDEYENGQQSRNKSQYRKQTEPQRHYYENDSAPKESKNNFGKTSLRRSSQELISEQEPILIKPTAKLRVIEPRHKTSTAPTTTATKYILKTVIKRPVPFSLNNENLEGSTEDTIDTNALIEKALENSRLNDSPHSEDTPTWDLYDQSEESARVPAANLQESLANPRAKEEIVVDTTTSSSTTHYTAVNPRESYQSVDQSQKSTSRPSYYTYRLVEDNNDQTTEVFSTKAKSLLKAFISNFVTTSKPKGMPIHITSTTAKTTTETEQVVNIGFKKNYNKYVDNKPYKSNFPRLQIITEPTISEYIHPSEEFPKQTESEFRADVSITPSPATVKYSETTPTMLESTTNNQFRRIPSEMHDSRLGDFITSTSTDNQNSRKFSKFVPEESGKEINSYKDSVSDNKEDNELNKLTNYKSELESEIERDRIPSRFTTTTTSLLKSTSTYRPFEMTTPTRSLPFPTRASRVNPAIKLAATNPGGGRRSYQSSTKCTDNGLQENPKCNEIKYQRPSLTRGRGSAHYSTLSGSDPQPPQQTSHRGTPPTRTRPTLKPSTAIVSKSLEFVDIYANPPRRPSPVYPQPTPDKTAAKCRKDVCLLPDCSCGGKEIPGDLPVESVPQIVLLTFDDSVNDLNKVLYQDLFDKGRVNPNGCPISATFYVSHEWTDYSQVQNLYSAGHEMASHTISHSFGEQFSQKKWNREVGGQREILAAYGGVKLEDVRGMRAPFLSVGGNKMFKMLYDSNFTYDSSMPVYENKPPSWPYTLDYKLFHDCMIPPCPTKSYPGVWEVPMVMWQDLNGGRCSMGDACANPPNAEGVYKMLLKNFDRHYTTNRAPFGLFYHAAWFTQPHHKEGFIMFLDFINRMNDVWIVTNWQALQWVRDPTPINRINNFQPFQCDYADRPKKCNNPKICNLWHKSGVRYMRTCQPCPEVFPWTGKTGIRSSRIDNDIEE